MRLGSKLYERKDKRTRRRYDAIFNVGFKAGAKARVVRGIRLPPGFLPRRSGKIPAKYLRSDERSLWSSGYRLGYAIGTPASENQREIEYCRSHGRLR